MMQHEKTNNKLSVYDQEMMTKVSHLVAQYLSQDEQESGEFDVEVAVASTPRHGLVIRFIESEVAFVKSLQDLVLRLETNGTDHLTNATKLILTRHQGFLPHLQSLISPTRSPQSSPTPQIPKSPQLQSSRKRTGPLRSPNLQRFNKENHGMESNKDSVLSPISIPKVVLSPGVRTRHSDPSAASPADRTLSPNSARLFRFSASSPNMSERNPALQRSLTPTPQRLSVSPVSARRTRRGSAPVVIAVEGRLMNNQIQEIRRQGSLERLKEEKQTKLRSSLHFEDDETEPSPRTPQSGRRTFVSDSPSRSIANFLLSHHFAVFTEAAEYANILGDALKAGREFSARAENNKPLVALLLAPIRRLVYYQSFIDRLIEHDSSLREELVEAKTASGNALADVKTLVKQLQTVQS